MDKPILRLRCDKCGALTMKHRVYIGKMDEVAGKLIDAGWRSKEKAFYCPHCSKWGMKEETLDNTKVTRKLIFREIMHAMIDYIEDQSEMDI